MRGLDLSRRTAAIAGSALLLVGAGTGFGVWLHSQPLLHVASSAQECINAPDHLASLFSDDDSTAIRLSNLDYSDLRTLRSEPASSLPGMFDSLLALSSDSRRLAFVTASDELMDDARIHYLDVSSPQATHDLVLLPQGLAPVRPAWSPDASMLAYVVGRSPSAGQPARFEVWTVSRDGSRPPQKVSDLPLDVFARGHTASLCWTPAGQIGLLPGLDSSGRQPGPLLLKDRSASAPRTQATPPGALSGSPCGVPVMSQNDPSWRDFIMQAGGDPIGGFGCALTSTTMLLNYYGSSMSPADLNACLGPGADPIVWTQAPLCTAGRVQGGERSDFSWDAVDGLLRAGKPAIVGMLRGLTGMHFVVVTQGGGGEADNYHITDPWDGTVSKTLGSYTNTGYNPRWLVSYDGSGRNCARLLPPSPPLVRGFQDGATYRGGVSVSVPSGAPGATVQPASGQGSSGQPGGPASGTRTQPPSGSASGSRGQSPGPGAGGPGGIRVEPGHQILIDQEGVYLVYVRHPGSAYPPRFSILKFAIDRTPPTLSLVGLDQHPGAAPLVLDRPGRLLLDARDLLSGVASIDYQLDGSAQTAYSDDVSFRRALLVPGVGTHTISFRATDLAGNLAELDTRAFEVVDVPGPAPTASPDATPTPTPAPAATTAGQPTPAPRPTIGRPTNPPPTTPPPTPPPTPVTHTADQFVGTWSNDDSNTSGITHVIIDQDGPLFVHPFGRCQPTDCDWGVRSVSFTGEPVVVRFDFGGGLVHTISMSLLDAAGSHLQVVDDSTAGGVHTYTFHR